MALTIPPGVDANGRRNAIFCPTDTLSVATLTGVTEDEARDYVDALVAAQVLTPVAEPAVACEPRVQEPLALTVKVTLPPGLTAWLCGCWMYAGALLRVRTAPVLVADPRLFVIVTV